MAESEDEMAIAARLESSCKCSCNAAIAHALAAIEYAKVAKGREVKRIKAEAGAMYNPKPIKKATEVKKEVNEEEVKVKREVKEEKEY